MDLKTAMIALLQSGEKTQANTDIIIEGLTFVKDSIPQLLSNQCDLAHDHQHMEAQLAKIMQAVDLLSKSEISEGVRRSRISVFAPGSKPPTGEHTVKVTTGQVLRRDKVPAGMSTNKMQAMLAARSQVRPDAQLMATASTLGRVDIDVFGDGVDVDCDVDAQVFALVDEFEITPYLLVAPSPHGASVGQRATVFPPLQDEEGGAAAAPSASDAVSSVDVSEEAHTIPLANGGPV